MCGRDWSSDVCSSDLQNLQDIYDNRGGFTSQWQTVGSDRIMIQDDGSAIGINTETGEQYALSPEQVQQMIDRKLLNTYESGYYTATGGNRNGPGGSGRTADSGGRGGGSGGGGGPTKSRGAIGAGMAALSPGGGGALPGSLRETMLAAAPVGQSSNTAGSALRQLSDTLGPLDVRALQTIKIGRAHV